MSYIFKGCLFLGLVAAGMHLSCTILQAQEGEIIEEPSKGEEQETPSGKPVILPPVQEPSDVPTGEPPVETGQVIPSEEESAPIVVSATEPPVLISIRGIGEEGTLPVVRERITQALESPDPALARELSGTPADTFESYGRWLATPIEEDKPTSLRNLEFVTDEQREGLINGVKTELQDNLRAAVDFATRILDGISALALVVGASPVVAIIPLFDALVPLFNSQAISLWSDEQIRKFNDAASLAVTRIQNIIDTASETLRAQLSTLVGQIQKLSKQLQQVRIAPVVVTGL